VQNVVSDPGSPSAHDSTGDIVGGLEWLSENRDRWDALAMGIGYSAPRLAVATDLEKSFGPEMFPSLIHPSAVFDRASAELGHGVVVCAQVAGTVNLDFGPFAAINYGCTVGHESVIGRGATLLPGSNVGGGVQVGEGVLVGSGAQVLQYLEIGKGAVIGAGSLVTKSVPAGKTAVGMPARWSRG